MASFEALSGVRLPCPTCGAVVRIRALRLDGVPGLLYEPHQGTRTMCAVYNRVADDVIVQDGQPARLVLLALLLGRRDGPPV